MKSTDIKAGDRVWLGNYRHPHNKIETVSRITPTQIVIGEGYYRYKRVNGARIGGFGDSLGIDGLATAEECAVWDARQKVEAEAEAEHARCQQEHSRLQKELSGLFSLNSWVGGCDEGRWELHMEKLTEGEVRELAVLLQYFGTRKGRRA